MEPADADRYFREVERLRARYPELSILCGVEADFYDGFEKTVEEFLGRYPLDLVLLSVHFVRDWPGENWVFDFDFPGRPLAAIYHDYFEALKRGIAQRSVRRGGPPGPDPPARPPGAALQCAGRGGGAVAGRPGGHEPGDQHLRHAPLLEAALPPAGHPAAGRPPAACP